LPDSITEDERRFPAQVAQTSVCGVPFELG
jgi:hypothetical protein